MATSKKVTRVSGGESSANPSKPVFVPTAESKSQAQKYRMYAVILWVLAVVAEVIAMVILSKKDPDVALSTGKRVTLIAILAVDLVLLIIGSSFWKKANRFDPASKQNAVKFFLQNQLGVIVAAVAFVPVVILAFVKKEFLIGAIAAIFMLGGGAASADYNPPSQEEYASQTSEVEMLNDGNDYVFWTKSGTRYHLSDSCSYINTDRTDEILTGTVAQARELKNITELCSLCKNRAMKAHGVTEDALQQAMEAIPEGIPNN